MNDAPLNHLTLLAKEAWRSTQNSRRQYWLALCCLLLLAIFSYSLAQKWLEPLLLKLFSIKSDSLVCIVILLAHILVTSFILTPLLSGIMRLGIASSLGQTFSIQELFKDYRSIVPLGIAYFIYLGASFCFFINPLIIPPNKIITLLQDQTRLSIGLFVFLLLSRQLFIPLISVKQLSVWQSFKTIRQKLKKHWFKMALLSLSANLIVILSVIPFGIGLIWSLPYANNIKGVIYRELFIKNKVSN